MKNLLDQQDKLAEQIKNTTDEQEKSELFGKLMSMKADMKFIGNPLRQAPVGNAQDF